MSAQSDRNVLLAAGGTGGHLMPALAVAEELTARGATASFVTTPSQVEHLGARYPVTSLEMRGLERRLFAIANLRALALALLALPRVWRLLSRLRPAVVVGCGGYVTGPVVALAALRGIPAVALESDAHLGITNRLVRRFVQRLCLSFPIAGLEEPRYVVTGRPLLAAQLTATREAGLTAFGLAGDLPLVLVFGGSQGARTLNEACLAAFARADLPFEIIHVCGSRDFAIVAATVTASGVPVERYRLVAYTDRLALAMAAADLVVGRSGGSVAEIAALGRPAVLVPYPYASADHQSKNAEWMAAAGAALVIADAELDGERLAVTVTTLLADRARLARMAAASAALGRPDATARVVDQIETIMKGRPA